MKLNNLLYNIYTKPKSEPKIVCRLTIANTKCAAHFKYYFFN